jgi:hypothetical protein
MTIPLQCFPLTETISYVPGRFAWNAVVSCDDEAVTCWVSPSSARITLTLYGASLGSISREESLNSALREPVTNNGMLLPWLHCENPKDARRATSRVTELCNETVFPRASVTLSREKICVPEEVNLMGSETTSSYEGFTRSWQTSMRTLVIEIARDFTVGLPTIESTKKRSRRLSVSLEYERESGGTPFSLISNFSSSPRHRTGGVG